MDKRRTHPEGTIIKVIEEKMPFENANDLGSEDREGEPEGGEEHPLGVLTAFLTENVSLGEWALSAPTEAERSLLADNV